MLKIKKTCPLGSECETVVGDEIHRCAWYVNLEGNHPQTGDKINQRRCAMEWQPLLMIQGNGMQVQVAASVQSLRNETIKRQDKAMGLIANEKIRQDK